MGVKLQDIIIRKQVDLSELNRKIIAIDAPNIIMSLFNFAIKNKENNFSDFITDRTQRAISHLYGLLYRVNFYYSKSIFPIFCFDGRVSELKRIITKDQLHDFKIIKEWYQEAIKNHNFEKARKISLGKEFLWPNIIEESKNLLNAIGVPFIDSPGAAEAQCAYLVKSKIAHYSNSQDFDSILFGCPSIIQNLSKSLRRKVQGKWLYQKITPLLIDLHNNLKSLNIDQFQLIDLAILLGTDYNQGIKGIGPKKALLLIKKHNSLESIIIKEKKNYDFLNLTSDLIYKIRKLFIFPEVITKPNNIRFDFPNRSRIIELLCENHTLNRDRVKNNVDKLFLNFEKVLYRFKNNNLIQKTLDI